MSDTAKKARAAMKAKAQRLGGDRPLEKVDSSSWTPPAMLNADVKTGLRPVSPRAYKRGGKVQGEHTAVRADRKPRKSGGEVKEWVNAKINRNVKEANEKREGVKHIGGMKKGGVAHRKHRDDGGEVTDYDTGSRTGAGAVTQSRSRSTPPMPQRRPAEPDYDTGSRTGAGAVTQSRKSGGRAKKMDGGMMAGPTMGPVAGANQMMQRAAGTAGVPNALLGFRGGGSRLQRFAGLKKGGKAEGHPDEAADKALIKKMVKPEARTGKKHGGERKARKEGGGVFSGPGYPGKVPGVSGGRKAHAAGGKAHKGKTDINIMINPHHPDMANAGQMPPQPLQPAKLPGSPGAMPVPTPPPAGGMPMPMGMPMGMPPGMMGAGMPPMPPGGAPLPRKSGGRTYRSYKDMDAGAGGGKGREEKTEIASRKNRIDAQNY